MQLACPIPIEEYPLVTLAHGGGGRLMRQLIGKLFGTAFDNAWLREQHDGAILPGPPEGHGPGMLPVLTTDSFVVSPRVFPGGDIGELAICGTVNDLAMCGAIPRHLTCSFVIEEGLAMDELWQVASSMARTAAAAGVEVVTGDTKVVDRGKADGLFVNTAGLGWVEPERQARPARIEPGDALIVSGDVGRHGVAVLGARGELGLGTAVESDCQPLNGQTRALIDAGIDVHCLRDATRGGLASALVELSATRGLDVHLDETQVPVLDEVRGACELLGLDPLYVANEGRFLAVVAGDQVDAALDVLHRLAPDDGAAHIGSVGVEATRPRVHATGITGVDRILDLLSGEQLPRIC